MTKYLTVRQVAATGLITENHLRRLVKDGQCPGIWKGKWFLIDVELLEKQLREEALKAVKGEG